MLANTNICRIPFTTGKRLCWLSINSHLSEILYVQCNEIRAWTHKYTTVAILTDVCTSDHQLIIPAVRSLYCLSRIGLINLIHGCYYKPKVFTSIPVVTDMTLADVCSTDNQFFDKGILHRCFILPPCKSCNVTRSLVNKTWLLNKEKYWWLARVTKMLGIHCSGTWRKLL